MVETAPTTYRHTQKGPWHWMLDGLGVMLLVLAWFSSEALPVRWMFVGLGALFLILGSTFRHLTVEDRGDHLRIAFGPLPLATRRVLYRDIRAVEPGRTTILDGWGIHLSPRGGWVWNIWGYDCVVIRLDRGTLRLGTDEPEALVEFLREKMTP